MKQCIALLLLAFSCAAADADADAVSTGSASTVNPIQKVIQLVSSLQAKIIRDGEQTHKSFEEFSNYCQVSSIAKQNEIKSALSEKETLQATIAKASADADESAIRIQELSGSIAADEQDLKAATLIRGKERFDFEKLDKELTDTVSILGKAQRVLENGMNKAGSSGAAFLQRVTQHSSALVAALGSLVDTEALSSSSSRAKLELLLQAGQDTVADDEAAALQTDQLTQQLSMGLDGVSKPSTSTILDALANMEEKAEASQSEARSAESNSKQNFELLQQSLKDRLVTEGKELDQAKKKLAGVGETKAVAEGDLEMADKELEAAKEYLHNLQHDCMERATDYQAEVADRTQELEALATAKKTIQAMTGGASQQSYSFMQTNSKSRSRARAALQQGVQASGVRAIERLRMLAKEVKSNAFAQLASRLEAAMRFANGADPFVKVRGLIQAMLDKLTREAQEAASQKAFCDREMKEAADSTKTKERDIARLSTRIDKASADASALNQEVSQLSADMANLVKAQAQMDQLRQEEHQAFGQAAEDLEQGIQGVATALKVLREYYAQGDAALVQTQVDVSGAMGDASEQPSSGAGSSIIGLLQVVESDFSKNLSEAKADEEAEQEQYKKTSQENALTKKQQESDVKHKTAEAKALSKAAAQIAGDRDGVREELDAVNEYYDKLKPQCGTAPDSYEVRKTRRETEIVGLKEALSILDTETGMDR